MNMNQREQKAIRLQKCYDVAKSIGVNATFKQGEIGLYLRFTNGDHINNPHYLDVNIDTSCDEEYLLNLEAALLDIALNKTIKNTIN